MPQVHKATYVATHKIQYQLMKYEDIRNTTLTN